MFKKPEDDRIKTKMSQLKDEVEELKYEVSCLQEYLKSQAPYKVGDWVEFDITSYPHINYIRSYEVDLGSKEVSTHVGRIASIDISGTSLRYEIEDTEGNRHRTGTINGKFKLPKPRKKE
jgi:hypothetical protein